MRVTVRLFARHREIADSGVVELDVPEGSDVEAVFGCLTERYPQLRELERWTTFACNRRVVDRSDPVHDGDEVALLQPVSGGVW